MLLSALAYAAPGWTQCPCVARASHTALSLRTPSFFWAWAQGHMCPFLCQCALRTGQVGQLRRPWRGGTSCLPVLPLASIPLSQYADEDDDSEDTGEKVESPTNEMVPTSRTSPKPSSPIPSIPTTTFYGISPLTRGTK